MTTISYLGLIALLSHFENFIVFPRDWEYLWTMRKQTITFIFLKLMYTGRKLNKENLSVSK